MALILHFFCFVMPRRLGIPRSYLTNDDADEETDGPGMDTAASNRLSAIMSRLEDRISEELFDAAERKGTDRISTEDVLEHVKANLSYRGETPD